jgi:hypothetical protein
VQPEILRMHIADSEFFDKIDEIGIDIFVFECIIE